jgi:hypothetical protein
MAKKSKSTPKIDTSDFPALDTNQNKELMATLQTLLAADLPPEAWPIPAAIDVHFLSTADGRREARFVFSTPNHPLLPSAMRFVCQLDKETVRDATSRGQEAIWEWLRNNAVGICTEALVRNLDMPDRISLQLSKAVRFHDVDRDREFLDKITTEARKLAMRQFVGKEVTE